MCFVVCDNGSKDMAGLAGKRTRCVVGERPRRVKYETPEYSGSLICKEYERNKEPD